MVVASLEIINETLLERCYEKVTNCEILECVKWAETSPINHQSIEPTYTLSYVRTYTSPASIQFKVHATTDRPTTQNENEHAIPTRRGKRTFTKKNQSIPTLTLSFSPLTWLIEKKMQIVWRKRRRNLLGKLRIPFKPNFWTTSSQPARWTTLLVGKVSFFSVINDDSSSSWQKPSQSRFFH